jgi:hypothetical protein
MDGRVPLERPGGFAEAQDEFLTDAGTDHGRQTADHELIRRLARERMLARDGGAALAGGTLRTRGRFLFDR